MHDDSIIEEMRNDFRTLKGLPPPIMQRLYCTLRISEGWVHYTLMTFDKTVIAEGKQRSVKSAKFMAEDDAYGKYDPDHYNVDIVFREEH